MLDCHVTHPIGGFGPRPANHPPKATIPGFSKTLEPDNRQPTEPTNSVQQFSRTW